MGGGIHTILVAGRGTAWPDAGAATEEGLPVSVGLRRVRLRFAWLAGMLLLLLCLLRGLSVGHGDLLLVEREGVRGEHSLPTPGPRTALHRHLWHLRRERDEEKGLIRCSTHTHTHNTQAYTYLPNIWAAPYLMTVIAGRQPFFLCVHYSP